MLKAFQRIPDDITRSDLFPEIGNMDIIEKVSSSHLAVFIDFPTDILEA